MLRKLTVCGAALVLAAAGATGPAGAHHSYAMFDQTQTLTLSGAVVKWDWTNPHAFLELMADGKHWELESASPSILTRAGMSRNIMKAGDKVTLTMHPRRDKAPGGYLLSVAIGDGKMVNLDAARQQQP
ncbi:MAG TPA: DUF6152 family protein [Caulobacteraceae bacterium]|jgi:hypothetical protein|nr:DUF6152 family protein [Caulobacteraceae bacterium]